MSGTKLMSEKNTLIMVYPAFKIQRDDCASFLMVGNLSFTLERISQQAPHI